MSDNHSQIHGVDRPSVQSFMGNVEDNDPIILDDKDAWPDGIRWPMIPHRDEYFGRIRFAYKKIEGKPGNDNSTSTEAHDFSNEEKFGTKTWEAKQHLPIRTPQSDESARPGECLELHGEWYCPGAERTHYILQSNGEGSPITEDHEQAWKYAGPSKENRFT